MTWKTYCPQCTIKTQSKVRHSEFISESIAFFKYALGSMKQEHGYRVAARHDKKWFVIHSLRISMLPDTRHSEFSSESIALSFNKSLAL